MRVFESRVVPTRVVRTLALIAAATIPAACASDPAPSEPARSEPAPPGEVADQTVITSGMVPEPRTRSAFEAVPMFFVHLVPDILSDTLCYLFNPIVTSSQGRESQAWAFISLASPIIGPVVGIKDAAEGRPFWEVTAICGADHQHCTQPQVDPD